MVMTIEFIRSRQCLLLRIPAGVSTISSGKEDKITMVCVTPVLDAHRGAAQIAQLCRAQTKYIEAPQEGLRGMDIQLADHHACTPLGARTVPDKRGCALIARKTISPRMLWMV